MLSPPQSILSLQKGTCIILSVNYRPLSAQNQILVLDNNNKALLYKDFKKGKSYQTKYIQRPLQYKDVIFFKALTYYKLRGTIVKGLPRGSLRLLSYYLKYKNNPANSIYKDYCYMQIILLEGLQRSYLTLLVILELGYTFNTYSNAYRQYRRYYKYPNLYIALLEKL